MEIEERRRLSDELNEKFRRWREINRKIDRVLLLIILLAVLMAGCAMIEDIAFLRKGIGSVSYNSFDELLAINPDTVAWLTIDDTHIDHPRRVKSRNGHYRSRRYYSALSVGFQ